MTTAEKISKKNTYTDYLTWPDEERWELIDGIAYNMTPAPSFRHQAVAGAFFVSLTNKLVGKACMAVIAPTDVILSEQDVVQPDVFVVCDKKKITESNVQGAPGPCYRSDNAVHSYQGQPRQKSIVRKARRPRIPSRPSR